MAPKSITEKLDQLLESNARLEQVVIGDESNNIPGLCGRVKRLEDGVFKVAAIASAISVPIGFFMGMFIRHI